ncbi:hypothetical protein ACPV3S_13320 [Photobacterium damselae]|uniref:hypothetical protein n=1 Tax=Photobacterium damselae TaxID=38293 RepID=UPI001F23C1BB|nr:hypothetical protein [Photobacterium damselae]UKA30170.1 hypothetical protein IPQ37_05645 [Photobacterium damselae subsp. damselae]
MPIDHFSGESVLSKMPEVLEWLTSFGFKALSTRYSRYIKYIDAFFESENPDSEAGRAKFDALTKSYKECVEILIIKTVFCDEKSEKFKSKLKEVIKGKDHLDSSSACGARDYLYELIVAAKFSKAGYSIDWEGLTDVVASKSGVKVFIECKRITSEKRFEENFNKAGKQLKREMAKEKGTKSGLVFIDVSNCIVKAVPNHEVSDPVIAKLIIDNAVNGFVKRNSYHIESLNQKYSRYSLGVCLTGQASIWTEDLTHYLVSKTDVRAYSKQSDIKFQKLNSILNGIENSFIGLL